MKQLAGSPKVVELTGPLTEHAAGSPLRCTDRACDLHSSLATAMKLARHRRVPERWGRLAGVRVCPATDASDVRIFAMVRCASAAPHRRRTW